MLRALFNWWDNGLGEALAWLVVLAVIGAFAVGIVLVFAALVKYVTT